MDGLSERWLGHKPIAFAEVAGSGRNFIGFARAPDRQGHRLRRRGRRRDLAPVARPEAAPRRRGHDHGLRDPGAAARRAARAHGGARRVDRPQHSLASLRRVRARHGAHRGGNPDPRRRAAQSGLAQADQRRAVRTDGSARRQKDADRRLVHQRQRARRPRRRGSSVAAQDSGLAPALQAQIDLYRRAAGLRQPDDASRAYELRPGLDDDGAAVFVRTEPAEHPDPQRGGPAHPPRLRLRGRAPSSFPPITARSSSDCSPISPTSAR